MRSKQGYKNILIHAVGSDVLLLSIAYQNKMIENVTEFINVRRGPDAKTYDVIQLRDMIDRSLAMPFFHAFTGYDTTPSSYCHRECLGYLDHERS